MKKQEFGLLLLAAFLGVRLAADCAPDRMLHIVTRVQFPSGVKTRTLYRVGRGLMRAEEVVGREKTPHLVIIGNEPDLWFIPRNETARHVVDKGPTFKTRVPVIGDLSSRFWANFEF